EQSVGNNRIEIEEKLAQSRKLLQKENIRRDQPINEQVHLKRPYQALNNSRSLEKDQNKKGISQHNYYKRLQKLKEVNVQQVESVDLLRKILERLTLLESRKLHIDSPNRS
ncbi:21353_t:CDS:1, partial [Gigaspora margarita]